MPGIPPIFAFALGCVIGLLVYSPVRHWVVTFRKTIRARAKSGDSPRSGSGALLLIFATMHPAPWLLLVGVPYALYCLWNDPFRAMWLWVLGGAVTAPALLGLYQSRKGAQPRP
jgi:hypothetical protein